jgi:hypothetical protein
VVAQILSVPFRLAENGAVAVVTQGSDQANAEQIGVLLTTIQGERQMVPGFGLPDPAFTGIKAGVIAAQVAMWGPPVDIELVSSTPVNGSETDVTVTFQ